MHCNVLQHKYFRVWTVMSVLSQALKVLMNEHHEREACFAAASDALSHRFHQLMSINILMIVLLCNLKH